MRRILVQDGSGVYTVLLKGLRTAELWAPRGFKRLDAAQDFAWLSLGLAVCCLSGHARGSNNGCRTSWRIILNVGFFHVFISVLKSEASYSDQFDIDFDT